MILTEEEITEVMERGDVVEGNRYLPFAYARAIEAKVLEKLKQERDAALADKDHWKIRAEAAYRLHELHNENLQEWISYGERTEKQITALIAERDAALAHADEEQKCANTYCQQLFERDAEIERLKHGLRIALEAIEHYAGPPKDVESIEAMRFLKELLK